MADASGLTGTPSAPYSLSNDKHAIELLLQGIAGEARGIMNLVQELDEGSNGESCRQADVLRKMAAHIGWLADLGTARFGSWAPAGVDGVEWFLTAAQAKALGLREVSE